MQTIINFDADEPLTTPSVRAMIKPWLTGDTERDARMLNRMFRRMFTLADWRRVVKEAA